MYEVPSDFHHSNRLVGSQPYRDTDVLVVVRKADVAMGIGGGPSGGSEEVVACKTTTKRL